MNIALIFAGGVGRRMALEEQSLPKQFLKINSKPVIIHTLEQFQNHPQIDKIYIAINKDYYEYILELVNYYHITKTSGVVLGGETGLDSIYKLINAASEENPEDSIVLIHDGVRPNITPKVISDNIECAKNNGNAITCTPCQETIVISSSGKYPEEVPLRKDSYTAQAPQTFRLGDIYDAYTKIKQVNSDYAGLIDSCTICKTLNIPTNIVIGNRGNIKITTIEDLYILRALIRFKEDVEAFEVKGFAIKDNLYGK